jgi:hypothetical protein
MSINKEFEDLFSRTGILKFPGLSEEQRWQAKMDFVYGALVTAGDIDRPEFEANAWKYAWRKSQERIEKLRAALEKFAKAPEYIDEADIASLLEEDSKLR